MIADCFTRREKGSDHESRLIALQESLRLLKQEPLTSPPESDSQVLIATFKLPGRYSIAGILQPAHTENSFHCIHSLRTEVGGASNQSVIFQYCVLTFRS